MFFPRLNTDFNSKSESHLKATNDSLNTDFANVMAPGFSNFREIYRVIC